ncbi:helix-turn-helix transcriptional regulator [Streptomyces litchfieldiae]|uniref:AAA family ATPase n=1 Tax=Streptomyces litchfieldiae TaxID=3075543 RepID=A0ABU2MRH2_9ACTN|nr:AAA family ATPase [Streptomyces sp. DSM 44938]MDT0344224.1 AAA family ATPase [Streptomyces sp. DSM 44938]
MAPGKPLSHPLASWAAPFEFRQTANSGRGKALTAERSRSFIEGDHQYCLPRLRSDRGKCVRPLGESGGAFCMLMIGREAELARLRTGLADCASRRASAVIIEGPVGSGKSELLEALAAHAAGEGAVVLRATALSSEYALPLGVMRQLAASPALAPDDGRRVQRLLDEDDSPAGGPRRPDRVSAAHAARMRRVCSALHEALDGRLTLIAVDDLHLVDATSLEYLLHITARSRALPLMTVFTEALDYRQWAPAHRTEFLRQPNFRRLHLSCLDRERVAALLAACGQDPPPDAVVDHFHSVTGGNPLLMRALWEDCQMAAGSAPGTAPPDPMPGDAFSHAVLTCLDRGGPMAAKVADGLAVLGEAGTPELLGRLRDLSSDGVAQGMRALRAAGLTDGLAFRHPAARAVVLDRMDGAFRQRLHRRAAALLRAAEAPAATVASHLAAVGRADEPWAVAVLQDAAEVALARDEDRRAGDYLRLALRSCGNASQRVDIRLRLALILQRRDLTASERTCDDLLADLRAGGLAPQQCLALADLFFVHRRIDEATEVLETLRAMDAESPPGSVGWVPSTQTAVVEFYHPWGDDGTPDPDLAPRGQRYEMPWLVPVAASGDEVVAAAEELLQRSVLTDSTFEPVTSAVKCLLHAGKSERARYWSETFLAESERRDMPGWYALFAGIRSGIAWQMGNPLDTEKYSALGLDRVHGRKESTLACGLLSLQVLAQTALGKYEAGARSLNQPTPEALFGSIHGLIFLRARGRYNLATNRLNVALDDFLAQGQLALKWRLDQPTWVPWRGDVAEVLLLLGEREEAERLVTEQLSLIGSGQERIRGVSLRLLAATQDPGKRLPLLTRAVTLLQSAGDRMELALALHDLAETHKAHGETAQATMAWRRAWQLAKECGAEPLCAAMRFEHKAPDQPEETVPRQGERSAIDIRKAKLSESEKRVAVLAACGYTNRDISSRLYISVSTVEQHLTRVYRKLKIGGREQLPIDLQFEVTEIV